MNWVALEPSWWAVPATRSTYFGTCCSINVHEDWGRFDVLFCRYIALLALIVGHSYFCFSVLRYLLFAMTILYCFWIYHTFHACFNWQFYHAKIWKNEWMMFLICLSFSLSKLCLFWGWMNLNMWRKNSVNYNFRECYLYENEKCFEDNFSIVTMRGICGRILFMILSISEYYLWLRHDWESNAIHVANVKFEKMYRNRCANSSSRLVDVSILFVCVKGV